ncbi:MAG: hypothetical protein HY897_09155 [Deltaproteobacteria bacterium]|nr:hypothetical protein [Deltaproteobacteria bacterium]
MKTKGGIKIPLDLASALTADPKVLGMWQRLRPSCQRKRQRPPPEAHLPRWPPACRHP